MLPRSLQEMQKQFERFPGIGPRQARRFVFHLLKEEPENIQKLANSLENMQKNVTLCEECYIPTENLNTKQCTVCSDSERGQNLLCIVEKESDAITMEKTKIHKGKYIILGENISPLKESKTAKTRLSKLTKKLEQDSNNYEIILGLNNTREGNFTSLYIQELFKKKNLGNIRITRLGRGLSTGSELEYADEETLRNALENRS